MGDMKPPHIVYLNRAHVFNAGVSWTTVAGLHPHAYVPKEAYDAAIAALPPAQPDAVEALVKAAEAQERERCAKVAESYWSGIPESEVGEAVCDAVFAVAAAIRAGDKP
jgi:hypothetical protein